MTRISSDALWPPAGAALDASLENVSAQTVSKLVSDRRIQQVCASFSGQRQELAEAQLELTRIAAPPFGEMARAEWLRGRFVLLGLEDVHVDEVGNVLGVRRGAKGALPDQFVLVSAHLDTVFPPETKIRVGRRGNRLYGPGISDNGAGVIAMLALASALETSGIEHARSIVFVGNVGEEGEGDLRGMRHFFANPLWRDHIAASIVLDGAGSDSIVAEALGSKRFQVAVYGPGGHSWSDFGIPNPIHALAWAIERFSRTPLPANPKTTFNVGVITGGTSVNTIPESATMRVDIRSTTTSEIERMERALRTALDDAVVAASRAYCETVSAKEPAPLSYEVTQIGDRPAADLNPDSLLLRVVQAVDQYLGNPSRVQRASTDANVPLSLGRDAVALGGGGAGGGAHTLNEWYDPATRELGLKRILLSLLLVAGAVPRLKES